MSTRERAAALSQLVARLVSTRERAQALAAASAARQRHSSGPHAPQRRHSHTRLLRWCCCCCRVTISSGTAETAVCMPLDQMVLLLLPSQSVLALPRPQLVNGRAVTISSGTAETAVCMPLSAAAHSEPHSQLVARLVSTRERAQALAAASYSGSPHVRREPISGRLKSTSYFK